MTPPASSDDWAVWYGGQRQCTGRCTSTFSPFLHIPCAELGFWIGFSFSKCFCFGFDLGLGLGGDNQHARRGCSG